MAILKNAECNNVYRGIITRYSYTLGPNEIGLQRVHPPPLAPCWKPRESHTESRALSMDSAWLRRGFGVASGQGAPPPLCELFLITR